MNKIPTDFKNARNFMQQHTTEEIEGMNFCIQSNREAKEYELGWRDSTIHADLRLEGIIL